MGPGLTLPSTICTACMQAALVSMASPVTNGSALGATREVLRQQHWLLPGSGAPGSETLPQDGSTGGIQGMQGVVASMMGLKAKQSHVTLRCIGSLTLAHAQCIEMQITCCSGQRGGPTSAYLVHCRQLRKRRTAPQMTRWTRRCARSAGMAAMRHISCSATVSAGCMHGGQWKDGAVCGA